MISFKHKIIFINTPKTGGRSVKSALNLTGTHSPLFLDKKNNPEIFNDYFKFAFVRNPWDRLVSTYFFLKKGGRLNEYDEASKKVYLKTDELNFKKFVKSLNKRKIWSQVHLIPQHYWIYDKNKTFMGKFLKKYHSSYFHWLKKDIKLKILFSLIIASFTKPRVLLADFLGRFETIDKDWVKICDKINFKHRTLPHINKSSHKHYAYYYDAKTRKIVADLYAKDIKLFGYKFNDKEKGQ